MKKLGIVTLLILVTASLSFGQADIGLKMLGGKVGYIMPDGIDDAIGFGVVAELGSITPAIHLDAFIDYWGKKYDSYDYEISFSEIVIGATGKYKFETSGQFQPYAGGGLAFIIAKSKGEYTGPNTEWYTGTDTESSDTELGFHFCGGADYPFSDSMIGFAEVRYVMSDGDYFGIYAGVKFQMGN
ncbi:hypothetical protein B6I21_03930 [candidate division KSB1 bacterium 4572_119]|nr:MAG: hypothetical protein B6I21_03930 [candidate division KSB1 bacterium 4572_119]